MTAAADGSGEHGQVQAAFAAAEDAEAATLWDDAVARYEECLSLVSASDDLLDEAALLEALGRCYWNLSEARTAWRTLRRAITLYRERGDALGMGRATLEILRIWGPPERHRAMAEEALEAVGDRDPHIKARLLTRLRWFDEDYDAKFNEAIAIAEKHGFDDVLTMRTERAGWMAFDEGHIDEGIEHLESAHETYARMKHYDGAALSLRGAAFATMQAGRLDDGVSLATRAMLYARSVHLRFIEQLALMNLAGVAFARGEFARCEELLAQSPGTQDFRADLLRMWMAAWRGDMPRALSLMVDPERGGGATNSLVHAANAGTLFLAGNESAARQGLQAWIDLARQGQGIVNEVPVLSDCLVALGDEALVRELYDAFAKRIEIRATECYSTLVGWAIAPVRGAVSLRLGLLDEAEARFREGLAWCERERCAMDATRCLRGLADVSERRGDAAAAAEYRDRAEKMSSEMLSRAT